jgi:hypothetical protein
MGIDELTKVGCGAAFLWSRLPDDGSPASFIHRCFQRETWRRSGTRARLQLLAGLLAWPFVVFTLIGFFSWHNAAAIRRRNGKGVIRQAREQLALAAGRAILPPWYYIFELYEEEKRQRAGCYLHRFETKRAIYDWLRDCNGGLPVPAVRSTEFLRNKALFPQRCSAFGLPAAPVLMVLENGRVMQPSGHDAVLPKHDIFVKPLYGTSGKGAERWEYLGEARYRNSQGSPATEAELLAHLRALTVVRGRGHIVLPRLVNHPDLADLSNGALTTVRLMTCRNEVGAYEVTNAVFRMAQGRNSAVDNFHAGGIAAKVDIHTGELGRAVDGAMAMGCATGWCDKHPDTGGQILGRQLPRWQEILNLVRRAHTLAFADQVVIGWDVALVSDGPLLIEGNKGPDVDLIQRSHGVPLGDARLGELLAFNLRRAFDS